MLYPASVCLLLGDRVEHSLSPLIHNTAFSHLGLPFVYQPRSVKADEIGPIIAQIDGNSIVGANVTIPHKLAVIPFLDELSEEAKAVGAVNTIYVEDGVRKGHNTDIEGFLAPLDAASFSGKNILVLGAGGAARAVLVAANTKLHPKKLTLVSRQLDKARAACDSLHCGEAADYSSIHQLMAESDLIVNTTPLGMPPLQGKMALPPSVTFSPHQTVYDLIYKPQHTPLLLLASQHGAKTIGGLPMLIAQAAGSFRIWTGQSMPLEEVKSALNGVLYG